MRRSPGSGIVGTALRLLACKNGLASGCGQVSVRICVNSRFYPPPNVKQNLRLTPILIGVRLSGSRLLRPAGRASLTAF